MVSLTPHFASLLAFVLSNSMIMNGVNALPRDRHTLMGSRGHHHHHHHQGHHHSHGYGSGRTNVYADDPLIVSGDGSHVHAHLDRRDDHGSHRHHGSHHGHHNTKVYADDPLVVSGNGNHIHSHSHKRGIVDPLIPLLSSVPGLPGIIDLVNMASHAVLSEKLASLIISSQPDGVSAQSAAGSNETSGFVISASNTSSSIMYLVPQNTSTSLAPPEKPVLVTMPMFDEKEKGLKMYCASYDPSPSAPIQISSEPCMGNTTASASNSTSPRTSQLFSWNTQSGEITPMWNRDPTQPPVDTTSAPGGVPDPASQGSGFVVGQSAATIDGTQSPSSTISMIFHAVDSSHDPNMGSGSLNTTQTNSTVGILEASTVAQSTETAASAA